MIGLWFLQNEDFPAANHHKNLVARFQAQRYASLRRDYDLVLRGKPHSGDSSQIVDNSEVAVWGPPYLIIPCRI